MLTTTDEPKKLKQHDPTPKPESQRDFKNFSNPSK